MIVEEPEEEQAPIEQWPELVWSDVYQNQINSLAVDYEELVWLLANLKSPIYTSWLMDR